MSKITLKYDSTGRRYYDPSGEFEVVLQARDIIIKGSMAAEIGGGGGDGVSAGYVSTAVSNHNTDNAAHADIRSQIVTALKGFPTYNATTHVITFTRQDGATFSIDLPLETLQKGWDYDTVNKEFVLTRLDGSTTRIDASEFVKAYIGSTGGNIQITVDNNGAIHASLLDGSIGVEKLTAGFQAVISGKLGADHNTDVNAHSSIRQAISGIEDDLVAHNAAGGAHQDIRDLISSSGGDVASHNSSNTAHTDIRNKIGADIATHNSDANAHSAIKQAIDTAAGNCLSIISGSDPVNTYTVMNFADDATAIAYSEQNPNTIVFAMIGD